MEAFCIIGPESEWFWVMVQAVAVIVTGFFILRQLRLQKNAHLVSSFAILHDRWNSQMMLRARHTVCQNHKHDLEQIPFEDALVGMFFEELGGYCRLGHLDIDIAWENYSFYVEHYWIMLRNQIICYRKNNGNDSSYYYHFEKLYHDFRDISRQKKTPSEEKTADDIKRFIAFENKACNFLDGSGGLPLPAK